MMFFSENATLTKTTPVFTLTPQTRIQESYKYNPVGVMTTPFSSGTFSIDGGAKYYIAPYANSATPTSGREYWVMTVPIYITVSGGTVSNIVIKDRSGGTVASGMTSLTAQYLPVGFRITITYSSAPTVVVSGL